jgi:hypothetical protein
MSNIGRPRVFDDVKRNQVTTLLSVGFGLREVARYVGCSVNTVRRAMQRDEEFAHEVQSAEVRAQLEAIRGVRAAASTHWRAAAWFLERTNPHRFARPSLRAFSPDEIQAVFEDVITAAADEIDDPELRARVCRRLMLAGAHAARALDSDPTRRVDSRSVLSDTKAQPENMVDRLLREVEENSARRWNDAVASAQAAKQQPPAAAPSANNAEAKPAA